MASGPQRTQGAASRRNSLSAFFKDERTRVICGMLLIGFAALLFLACLSFLFTWKSDQSFDGSDLLTTADIHVQNWCGRLGARLATLTMYRGFGIAAFFFPMLCFIGGMRLLNVKMMRMGSALRLTIFGAILGSLLCSYLFGGSNGYLGNGLGGGHGMYMIHWLEMVLGHAGTGILVFLLCIIFLIFTFKRFPAWCAGVAAGAGRLFVRKTPKAERDRKLTKTTSVKEQPAGDTLTGNPPVPDPVLGNSDEDDWEKVDVSDTPQAVPAFRIRKPEPTATMTPTPDNKPYRSHLEPESGSETPDNGSDALGDVKLTITKTIEEEKADSQTAVSRIKQLDPYDPTLDLHDYKMPPIDLLADYAPGHEITQEELISNKNKIVETLAYYKIKIMEITVTPGPTVTLYEIVPSPETRIARIKSLENDIAMRLKALGVRIIAPIPGKGTIGLEVPNKNPEIVSMRSLIASKRFQESKADIAIALGKTISDETFVFDLAKMPHLLVAGATGQGKSVGLNAIITSILYKKHPAELKFVLVDPKTVEFSPYEKIERHFLAKMPDVEEAIITDTQKVINTIQSLCLEMDTRYNLLKDAGVRNIKEYNAKFTARQLNPEEGHRFLPYIVVIIDEFADLIMTAGKEIEMPIARLAQKARAAGMHLIVATQRPTTNIITGTIKANFPARIAFKVTSQIDSRTILDGSGAEQLIGRGDLLFNAGGDTVRIQCGFIDIPEIEEITSFIGNQQGYPEAFPLPEYESEDGESGAKEKDIDLTKRDALFNEAARLVVMHQTGSTSLIQRKFRIGYPRAGYIMDQLEAAGIVGPFEGSKARKVLFMDEGQLEQYLQSL